MCIQRGENESKRNIKMIKGTPHCRNNTDRNGVAFGGEEVVGQPTEQKREHGLHTLLNDGELAATERHVAGGDGQP